MCVEPAGPADAGLNFVEYEKCTALGGDPPSLDEVSLRRHHDAALTHDRFEEHSGGVGIDSLLECLDIAVRHELDTGGHRLERRPLGRLPRQRECPHRATVEGAFGRDDLLPAGGTSELEGSLVRLGTGIAEEGAPAHVAEMSEQLLRQLDDRLAGVQVGNMAECRQLSSDGFDDGRMSVSEDVDGDSSQEVDVLLAVGIGEYSAVTADESNPGTP